MTGEIRNHFESRLESEILISEMLRATILGAFFVTALVFWIVLIVAFPEVLGHVFHGQLSVVWVFVFIMSAALYELGARVFVGHIIRHKLGLPVLMRYVNAFVETTLPTIMLVIYAQTLGPTVSLLSPWSLVYFVIILLSALRLDFKLCYFTGAMAAVQYTALALIWIGRHEIAATEPMLTEPLPHIAKGFLLLASGAATGFVTREIKKRIYNSLSAVEDRNRVVALFGQHVSPAVVDKLLEQNTDIRGQVRYTCIMFLDIRAFTTFAEHKTPEEAISYLNALFALSIEIVNRHYGIINKFLGDGFMAMFGVPLPDNHACQNAVNASLEILRKVETEIERGALPETRLGIGLHAGDAVVGNVGSSLRKEYTVIGDVVNTASRIEQLNKQFQSRLLVSSTVWQVAGKDLGNSLDLGEIELKGRVSPIRVYQLA